jgi:SAM-dependent methyltransferase
MGGLVNGYDPSRYGDVLAGRYDVLYPGAPAETRSAVDFIASLAGDEDAGILEFGIGTGRLALPLRKRQYRVAGIDGSEQMLATLRAKPFGNEVHVVQGDYRDVHLGGRFMVVVLALNGIFDPRGRSAQLDIFRNAARHLASGGYFVIESWVMTEQQRGGDWSVIPRFVGDEHVEFQLARYDIDTNSIERTLVHLRPSGLEFVTVSDTYASPGELDVMAEVTGFERHCRFQTWARDTFTSHSASHVTVYQRTVHDAADEDRSSG